MRLGLVIIALCAAPLCAQENLVVNPGFEEATPDGEAPLGWHLPSHPGVEFAWDDRVARSGARSARVTGTDPDAQATHVMAWRQNVGPLPEDTIWVSVWLKADDLDAGSFRILHRDEEGQVLRNEGIHDFSGTFDWREIGRWVEPAPGAREFQLVMGLRRSTGSVWIDDVRVVARAEMGDDLGRLSMTAPERPATAGEERPVEFTVEVGRDGLAPGAAVVFRFSHWRPGREFSLGELEARTDNPTHVFEASMPERRRAWPPTPQPVAGILTLREGPALEAGDTITITGNLRHSPFSNVTVDLLAFMSAAPDAAEMPLDGAFTLSSVAGPPARLMCTAEARPVENSPGRVTVAVTDEHGNPCENFTGTVTLSCNTDAQLPARHTFTPADRGSRDFAVAFPPGEVSRVTVTSGDMSATSNPVLPRTADEPGVYFGDLHAHCEISNDAVGSPDHAYEYARRFFGLDFAALTDHSPRGPLWERNVEVTNRHNVDGEFVTFLGFEWSHSRSGHRNAYYREDWGPQQPPPMQDNTVSWWGYYEESGDRVLTVPHHPNTDSGVRLDSGELVWGPVDWSDINHTYQRIVEICQNRGSFEVPGGPVPELRVRHRDRGASVQTALEMGHRLGFIGSTDTHSGRPGTGQARAVILSHEFTRPGLWDALHDRHCYATTGVHMLIFFGLNEQRMGAEIVADRADLPRRITWRAIGTGPVQRVDLLRSNEVVQSWEGGGAEDLAGAHERREPLDGTEWWYLRVIQEDTHIGWSSPIWVDPPG